MKPRPYAYRIVTYTGVVVEELNCAGFSGFTLKEAREVLRDYNARGDLYCLERLPLTAWERI